MNPFSSTLNNIGKRKGQGRDRNPNPPSKLRVRVVAAFEEAFALPQSAFSTAGTAVFTKMTGHSSCSSAMLGFNDDLWAYLSPQVIISPKNLSPCHLGENGFGPPNILPRRGRQ